MKLGYLDKTAEIYKGRLSLSRGGRQYNATTDIDRSYAIDQMPISEYTLVGAGNNSYDPNITWINVTLELN